MTNEDTVYMAGNNQKNRTNAASQPVDDKKQNTWKIVSLGGATGVLLGAGAVFASNAFGQNNEADAGNFHTLDNGLKVAEVSDDLSFNDALEKARAEVGAGGVFHWHGNTYSTYTAEEWSAMSETEKAEFTELARAEISTEDIESIITNDPSAEVAQAEPQPQPQPQPQEVHVHNHYHQAPQPQQVEQEAQSVQEPARASYTSNTVQEQPAGGEDSDVRIIEQGTIEGHDAVALDVTNDGEADVVVIDVNDNQELDEPDVIVDREGNWTTVGDLMAYEESQELSSGSDYVNMEDQQDIMTDDLSPDTPDYVDDADLTYV